MLTLPAKKGLILAPVVEGLIPEKHCTSITVQDWTQIGPFYLVDYVVKCLLATGVQNVASQSLGLEC